MWFNVKKKGSRQPAGFFLSLLSLPSKGRKHFTLNICQSRTDNLHLLIVPCKAARRGIFLHRIQQPIISNQHTGNRNATAYQHNLRACPRENQPLDQL